MKMKLFTALAALLVMALGTTTAEARRYDGDRTYSGYSERASGTRKAHYRKARRHHASRGSRRGHRHARRYRGGGERVASYRSGVGVRPAAAGAAGTCARVAAVALSRIWLGTGASTAARPARRLVQSSSGVITSARSPAAQPTVSGSFAQATTVAAFASAPARSPARSSASAKAKGIPEIGKAASARGGLFFCLAPSDQRGDRPSQRSFAGRRWHGSSR